MKLLSILYLIVVQGAAKAFTIPSSKSSFLVSITTTTTSISKQTPIDNVNPYARTSRNNRTFNSSHLQSSNDDENNNNKNDSNTITKINDYPLDVASPVLLASSMVLAIASTGSIFELSGGSPVLGFAPSVGITVLGIPLCFFLFYAAIKKGIAETEADDAEYQRKNNRF
eukprot:scaffold3606_cov276-Chaetoceros_neogracile.AAC.2